MDKDALLIISSAPDSATSEKIANALVEQDLAACVNILPGVRSIYKWQGKMTAGDEQLLLIKAPQSAYVTIEQQNFLKLLRSQSRLDYLLISIGSWSGCQTNHNKFDVIRVLLRRDLRTLVTQSL